MFHSARLKLTAWYLLSIMAISILFSLAAYQSSTFELRRGLRIQSLRIIPEQSAPPGWIPHPTERAFRSPFSRELQLSPHVFDDQLLEEAKRRVALNLITFNIGVFMLAGMAGYFLAGRTLKPIEEMVNEQKRFVADASHELRTPLTAMRTEVEVALRDKDFDAAYAKDVLKSNLEEIDKLQILSDHLLMLGRYQNETKSHNLAEVGLLDVVEEARGSIKVLADQKNIEIRSEVGDIKLEADKESLVKLLIIFLDNAIKYSHANGKIIIRTQLQKNKVVISIQDFGAGIRAGDLPHIFNRFYRADASRTKAKVEGYGLGLSIAKSIIDMHNGKVDVESSPDRGTTFAITLPIKTHKF